jgi:hypothetical protein
MKEHMKKLLQRLSEPSTWAALSVLSILFGVRPETAQAVRDGAGAVIAAASALGITPDNAVAAIVAAPTVVTSVVAAWLPERAPGAQTVEPVPTGPGDWANE